MKQHHIKHHYSSLVEVILAMDLLLQISIFSPHRGQNIAEPTVMVPDD